MDNLGPWNLVAVLFFVGGPKSLAAPLVVTAEVAVMAKKTKKTFKL